MKKAIIIVLAVVGILFGIFEYYISAPICLNQNGGKRTMIVKRGETMFPYKTCYSVDYNRISINGEVYDTWIEFVIWNGYGIKNIEVYAVDSGVKVYPAEEEPTYLAQSKGFLVGVTLSHTDTMNGRYYVVNVRPPEKETKLQVLVTDIYNNITEDVVFISSIKKL